MVLGGLHVGRWPSSSFKYVATVVTAKLGVREGKQRRGDLLVCVLSFLLTGGLAFGLLGHRCYIAGQKGETESRGKLPRCPRTYLVAPTLFLTVSGAPPPFLFFLSAASGFAYRAVGSPSLLLLHGEVAH